MLIHLGPLLRTENIWITKTYFTGRLKLLSANMSRFNRLPEFEKELKRLANKYRSLPDDLSRLEKVLTQSPTGIGTNFTIIHRKVDITIVKTRLACRSLKNRSLRLIYAYHQGAMTFMYLELYYKVEKESEDRGRIKEYLKNNEA